MKVWYFSYNTKKKYSANLCVVPLRSIVFGEVVSFLIHNVLWNIPSIPFPIIHRQCFMSDEPKWHVHSSYKYFGWSIGRILCETIEDQLTVDFDPLVSLRLTAKQITALAEQDIEIARYVDEINALGT